MIASLPQLSICSLADIIFSDREETSPVAFDHEGQEISFYEFQTHVRALTNHIKISGGLRWVIAEENAYALAVGIYSILHAGKQVVIPANLQEGHLNDLVENADGVIGTNAMVQGLSKYHPTFVESSDIGSSQITPFDAASAEIIIHTSGTTGDVLEISKPLRCLDAEVHALETTFGDKFRDLPVSRIYSSVPAYHIYGLLFRVLWPLATERPFSVQLISYPEEFSSIPQAGIKSIFISSPAFLKRAIPVLDKKFLEINDVCIFSSGGALPTEIAMAYNAPLKKPITEVYGSTETGGIGYRSQTHSLEVALWTPLPSVELKTTTENNVLSVRSDFLSKHEWLITGDRVELSSDGRFDLKGRVDKVVKIEEVRISLNEIERRLNDLEEINTVHVLPINKSNTGRQVLGAVVQLTDQGWEGLYLTNKKELVEFLRTALKDHIKTIGLPRKWRFVRKIPENNRGKVPIAELEKLFDAEQGLNTNPKILERKIETDTITLRLQLSEDISYFDGHFDQEPVLAGVVQIDWAAQYGQDYFSIPGKFQQIEALKFFKVQFAGNQTSLELRYRPDRNRLYFRYYDGETKYSSGRILFE